MKKFLKSLEGVTYKNVKTIDQENIIAISKKIRAEFKKKCLSKKKRGGHMYSMGLKLVKVATSLIDSPGKGVIFERKFAHFFVALMTQRQDILQEEFGFGKDWVKRNAKGKNAKHYKGTLDCVYWAVKKQRGAIKKLEGDFLRQYTAGLKRMLPGEKINQTIAKEFLSKLSGSPFIRIGGAELVKEVRRKKVREFFEAAGLKIYRFCFFPTVEMYKKQFESAYKYSDHAIGTPDRRVPAPMWYECSWNKDEIFFYEMERNKEIMQLAKDYHKLPPVKKMAEYREHIGELASIAYKYFESAKSDPELGMGISEEFDWRFLLDPGELGRFLQEALGGRRDREFALQVEALWEIAIEIVSAQHKKNMLEKTEEMLIEEFVQDLTELRNFLVRKPFGARYSLALFLPLVIGLNGFPFKKVFLATTHTIVLMTGGGRMNVAKELQEYDKTGRIYKAHHKRMGKIFCFKGHAFHPIALSGFVDYDIVYKAGKEWIHVTHCAFYPWYLNRKNQEGEPDTEYEINDEAVSQAAEEFFERRPELAYNRDAYTKMIRLVLESMMKDIGAWLMCLAAPENMYSEKALAYLTEEVEEDLEKLPTASMRWFERVMLYAGHAYILKGQGKITRQEEWRKQGEEMEKRIKEILKKKGIEEVYNEMIRIAFRGGETWEERLLALWKVYLDKFLPLTEDELKVRLRDDILSSDFN